MLNQIVNEFPNALEMEKKLISALMLKEGKVIPKIAAILQPDDFYRPEHRFIYRAILNVYMQGTPPDPLLIEEELAKRGELIKVNRSYLFALIDYEFTTSRAEKFALTIKEKANLRKFIQACLISLDDAQQDIRSVADLISDTQRQFNDIINLNEPAKKFSFTDYFTNQFNPDIENIKNYSQRLSGFDNLDQNQFFSPGLYVIGATPAAGKTTFCWQLLEQLALRGESCIFCSYEMSRLELFSKSITRELFKRVPSTKITAADIRRGAWSAEMEHTVKDFTHLDLNLSVFELQDESIDDLLSLLKPLCSDKTKAPIVCLDYLQIVPTSRDSAKLGIDDSVRKLKKFQRDTNTTFIVISSFNRTNYANSVSFESFKESGNIEYTADVVWALQLFVLNSINPFNIADTRKKVEEAKKRKPRQIQLKCLKNRQGTNYDCFFNYFSAHDCFVPCENFDEEDSAKKHTTSYNRKINNNEF